MRQMIQMRSIIIGITLLFLGISFVPFINIVQADIIWKVTVNFNEPGGKIDTIVLGEAPDANDGPPEDGYDTFKPPSPPAPYIRAYLDDTLTSPFNQLWYDYRQFPDTEKVWNLTVRWEPQDGVSSTTITMSWGTAEVDDSEYTNVSLYTNTGGFLKNMLVDTSYTFDCPALVLQKFKIICSVIEVNDPPVVTDIPNQTIAEGSTFMTISLDNYVSDPDHTDSQMTWTYSGNSALTVSIVSRVATITIPSLDWNGAETITFRATDPGSLWDDDPATFTVTVMNENNPPIFGTPTPTNSSPNNPLSLSWTIPINDPENDSFNWTIQCSNRQVTNANTAFNGTKSLSLSGLAYVTTYKIWVNATDPTGSANYTRKWYTFTTRSSSGGGGGGDDEPPNIKPNADVSAREPYQGYVNTEITFDGSKSNDSDGTITKWFWVFGDNTNGTGNTVRHTYSKTGTYTVTLTVTDNEGATNTDTTTCVIIQYNGSNNSPTTPVINGTRTGTKNKTYTYSIYSTDQNNDSLQYITTWGDGTQNTSNFLQNGTIFSVSHTWVSPGKYMITAIATDNMSISDQVTLSVFIDVFFVRELGFLFDSNNDGLNDSFYTNSTGLITPAQKLANESYLIDTDSDGTSNYLYNPSLNALTEIKKIETTAEFPWVYIALLLVVVVIVSCVAVFYLYQYGYI